MITRKSIIEGMVCMITKGQEFEKCCKRLQKFSNHDLADAYHRATGHMLLVHSSTHFMPV